MASLMRWTWATPRLPGTSDDRAGDARSGRVARRRFRAGRWGFIGLAPIGFGALRYRIVVLAPGAYPRDRALLALAEVSQWFGLGAWVGVVCTLAPTLARGRLEWLAVVVATAVAVLTVLLLHQAARPVRRLAREGWFCVTPPLAWTGTSASEVAAANAARMLLDADELRLQGRITAVEHELAWIRAWALLPPAWEERDTARAGAAMTPVVRDEPRPSGSR